MGRALATWREREWAPGTAAASAKAMALAIGVVSAQVRAGAMVGVWAPGTAAVSA